MDFLWDEFKRKENKRKHGIDFKQVTVFEFETALEIEDSAIEYAEQRIKAIGVLGDAICVLIYTMRDNALRVISLRHATRKEIESYVRYQEP